MRYLRYDEFVHLCARQVGLDDETFHRRHVNYVGANLVLGVGGGVCHPDELDDVTTKVFALVRLLYRLGPVDMRRAEIAYLEVARLYTRNRGWELEIVRGRRLLHEIGTRSISPTDARRELRASLTPTPGTRRTFPNHLRGVTVFIGHAVSCPSTGTPSPYLTRSIAARLRQLGARVLVPDPVTHVSSDGRSQSRAPGSAEDRARSTEEIFARSICRVSDADMVILLSDPQSQGLAVEREWALRLGTPIIEVLADEIVRPHQDGPRRVWRLTADEGHPQRTVDAVLSTVQDADWAIRDKQAAAAAIHAQTGLEHKRLFAAWRTLGEDERKHMSHVLGLSCAYIDGVLHSTRSLQLASEAQRRGLDSMLSVPEESHSPRRLLDHELRLLVAAAETRGLRGIELVTVIDVAEEQLGKTHLRAGLNGPEEALRRIDDAIGRLRNAAADDGK